MKKYLLLSLLTLALSPFAVNAQAGAQPAAQAPAQPTPQANPQAGHEYSPLVEKTVNYRNWSLVDLKSEKENDLRKLMAGKKLVMIVYFAPWCHNWQNEAPIAAKLYNKYKDQGFQIIGVSEYATREEVKAYFGGDPPYPIVTESESREEKEKTLHYEYRQLTGDTRNWGSPWNIFLEPSKLNAKGEMLAEKAWVVNGELIEDEVDKFIASKLSPASAAVIQPCKN